MCRIIKDDGAVFYNNKNRVQNSLLEDRGEILKDFPLRQVIIWKRSGAINFNDGYFLPTTEQIYLLCNKNFKLAKSANKNTDVWEVKQEMKNPHPAPFPEALIDRIISSTTGKIILLKNTLADEIKNMSLPNTKIYNLSLNLINRLDEDILIFCIAVKYFVVPVNKALTFVPADDKKFCELIQKILCSPFRKFR